MTKILGDRDSTANSKTPLSGRWGNRGKGYPEKRTKMVSFRMTEYEHMIFLDAAEKEGISLQAWILKLCHAGVSNV